MIPDPAMMHSRIVAASVVKELLLCFTPGKSVPPSQTRNHVRHVHRFLEPWKVYTTYGSHEQWEYLYLKTL